MEWLKLYHRTTRDAALRIIRERRFVSDENTREVFFSTRRDGQADGYGPAVIAVMVPEHTARIEDEFPSGEVHYAVRAEDLDADSIGIFIRPDIPPIYE